MKPTKQLEALEVMEQPEAIAAASQIKRKLWGFAELNLRKLALKVSPSEAADIETLRAWCAGNVFLDSRVEARCSSAEKKSWKKAFGDVSAKIRELLNAALEQK